NSKALNGLLKEAGLDMVMADSPFWENGTLALAVKNGLLPQNRLDDMGHSYPHHPGPPFSRVPWEATFWRKNANNALPLHMPKLLSLFGYDGVAATRNTMDNVTFDQWAMGWAPMLMYPNGTTINTATPIDIFLSSYNPLNSGPGVALNGTLITNGGSGATTPAYIDAPFDAFQRKAMKDGTFFAWDFASQKPIGNPGSEACIVFINEQQHHGCHPQRAYASSTAGLTTTTSPPFSTLTSPPGYRRRASRDHVRQIVPLGPSPYTVGKKASDYGNLLNALISEGDLNLWYPQDNFTEGFEFGFGLTYTNFSYADLDVVLVPGANTEYLPPGSEIAEGRIPSL
ncbi:hypothetical protein GB937_010411, partial [Aspergillus fischeri]